MRRPRRAPPVDLSVACDLWTGAMSSNGYGAARSGGRVTTAHAAAWEAAVGPIPAGYELHHACENRLCREIRHLELLTRAEHCARHAEARTTCPAGHPRSEHFRSNGGVGRCNECRRLAQRARRAARRAA